MTETSEAGHGVEPRRAVRVWQAGVTLVILVAVVGQLAQVIRGGGSVLNFFSYFTVQSNLLVLITACWLVADPSGVRGGPWRQPIRLASLTGITVTGVVYGSLIAPFHDPHGVERLYDVLFHYVSPVMAVLGFLVLGPRGLFRRADLWFILWPLAWLAYTLIRAEVGHPDFVGLGATRSRYPYGFLDVDLHGWGAVSISIVGVAVLLLALAGCYLWLDRRLPVLGRRGHRPGDPAPAGRGGTTP